MIYALIILSALMGLGSLAVDWGYVQCTKSEMQRQADATARGYVALYAAYGLSTAVTTGPSLYGASWNPVDSSSGINATVVVTWGYWNTVSGQFVAGTNATYPTAVRCTVSRKASTSNGLGMSLSRVVGWRTTDLTCSAVAILNQTQQTGIADVPATSDIWLSGMPSGSTASGDDTTANAPAYQATMIPVVPGTYLEFSSITGYASNSASTSPSQPDGDPYWVLSHDAGDENGIANLTSPIHALIGVFIGSSQPDSSAAPSARDYSTDTSRDQNTYDDIQLKQPFFIGDGMTSAGVSQKFMVPAGATRLYLGSMDGFEWNNNWGNYNATVTIDWSISLKK